jgi:hypothetical protein
MQDGETCRGLLPKYREIAAKILPSETLVYKDRVQVVNHATETLGGDPTKPGSRSDGVRSV